MFAAVTRFGVTGRALSRGLARVSCWNPRDFTHDSYGRVDDRPYGGGPGMVLMAAPVRAAIQAARQEAPDGAKVIYLTPQGRRLEQTMLEELRQTPGLILLAGRYEGIDERIIHQDIDMQISIGDYVLSGGELPAMVLMDALIRLLPGALGHAHSARGDSHALGLLGAPQYTRPKEIDGLAVPEVLLSGDHGKIERWRRKQALSRTARERPDLLAGRRLSLDDEALLNEYHRERELDKQRFCHSPKNHQSTEES